MAFESKLKTSKEVFDLVTTDQRFDPRLCDIVYMDRVVDRYKRCSASEWVPMCKDGDIPWHRVYFVEYKSATIWNREQRSYDYDLLCRLASGEEVIPYKNVLQLGPAIPAHLPADFTIVCLNVLFDLYDYRLTKLEPRLPRIGDFLARSNADVIMLQECTAKVFDYLRQQRWAQHYTLTHSELDPYGQITLARCQVHSAEQRHLTGAKRSLRTTFTVQPAPGAQPGVGPAGMPPPLAVAPQRPQLARRQNDGAQHRRQQPAPVRQAPEHAAVPGPPPLTLDIWNVHLPASDSMLAVVAGGGAPSTSAAAAQPASLSSRMLQLTRIESAARSSRAHAVIVAGDFNVASTPELGPLRRWADAWASLHGDQGGHTYDPESNALARSNSKSGNSARFDRVLMRGAGLAAAAVRVEGPRGREPMSDHHALVAELRIDRNAPSAHEMEDPIGEDQGEDPVAEARRGDVSGPETMMVWVVPPCSWPAINDIRRKHDPKAGKWPPHLTISERFPMAVLPEVMEELRRSRLHSFPMGPGWRVDCFEHDRSSSVVVTAGLAAAEQMGTLRDAVMTAAQQGMEPQAYSPHLTLGRLREAQEGDALARKSQALQRAAITSVLPVAAGWRGDRLCAVSFGDKHVAVHRILNLEGADPVPAQALLDCIHSNMEGMRCTLVGSHLLGALGPASDLDVLVVGALPAGEALPKLQQLLATCGLCYGVYEITNSHMRYLRGWTADRQEVDVHYLSWKGLQTPWQLPLTALRATIAEAAPAHATVLSMVAEPRSILHLVGEDQAWARHAGIYGQSFGYPGGLAWAILVAVAFQALPCQGTPRQDLGAGDAVSLDPCPGAATIPGGGQCSTDVGPGSLSAASPMPTRGGAGGQQQQAAHADAHHVAQDPDGVTQDPNRVIAAPVIGTGQHASAAGCHPGHGEADLEAVLRVLSNLPWDRPVVADPTPAAWKLAPAAEGSGEIMAAVPDHPGCDTASVPGTEHSMEDGTTEATSGLSSIQLGVGFSEESSRTHDPPCDQPPVSGHWAGQSVHSMADSPAMSVLLSSLPGTNAARAVLPSTAALVRMALASGAEGADAVVRAAADELPHHLELSIHAEDAEAADLAVAYLARHIPKLLMELHGSCAPIAPDSAWVTGVGAGVGGGASLCWRVRFRCEKGVAATAAAQLLQQFYKEVQGVALLHSVV